ncbi:MAG: transcription termination factor Rho [Planctomycetes bacterium]|nr:transcription termination factor Rho [Planctomycetota bacterium]
MSHPGDHDPLPPDELPPEEQARISAAAEAHGSDLQALEALSGTELLDLAHAEGLDVLPNLERGELIVQILQHRFGQRDLGQQAVGWHEGVLEILPDGFGFLRSVRNDYQPGPEDVYVSPSQVRRLNLKPGHQLAGPVRQPRRGEKYFALLHIERINGGSVMDLRARVPFSARTPILPHTRLRLDHPGASLRTRAIDLLAPWGKGQRALLAVPPGAGRTQLLQQLATALLHNHPDIHVAVCLVDERPEEVTALRRALAGPRSDVVASTFDEAPGRHLELAEMALARAQRWVEAGRDVVLLVDSLSALVRAYHLEGSPSGRMLCPGLDANAVMRPKRLFGAARQLEEGGSLTVVATALAGTDSRVDQTILDEFHNRGNSEILFDRELADLHVCPALDLLRTGTRREDLLLQKDQIDGLQRLRLRLAPLGKVERVQALLEQLQSSNNNDELLARLAAQPSATGR